MHPALLLLLAVPTLAAAQGTADDYKRANSLRERFAGKLARDKVEPRWAADGNTFWYRNDLPGGRKEFVRIDATAGTRTVLADEPKGGTPIPAAPQPQRRGGRPAFPFSPRSPDGTREAFVKADNVWLRDRKTGDESQLSKDGTAGDAYTGRFFWSPDSKKVVAIKTKAGGNRRVTIVESSPADQLQPKVMTLPYLKPGDDVPQPKPHLFDVASKKEVPVPDALFPNPWDVSFEHWSADSARFYFVYNQRGHQVVRVIAIDAATGTPTAVVTEECPTFFDYAHKMYLSYLDETRELVWMSERSGHNHLYLIDAITGAVKHAITRGSWVVRGVERLDRETNELTLRGYALDTDQDPYHLHFARVRLDGTGLTRLTRGDGTHALTYSPDRRFYLDTYSRADMPPVTELRRTDDGSLVCEVERADDAELRKAGWRPPERFVAKGRDGTTDIHGVIVRPTNFDPAKTYRVIENIYAGPQDFYAPKSFRPIVGEQRLAELGFVLVKLDGMGTNWRSKAFHDVCWKNLGDGGFPDRLAWIKAAAAKYPQLDISKGVGIYGGSAGGQNAMRGMTEYPAFYTAGVADCGCHDNRMDKVWWNELWMSWPVGPHYAAQSNVTNAHKVTGKLMLVVGEKDTNVDPASTMQVVNALIKADKDFDLLVVPGGGHGAGGSPYGQRRQMDFFVRHLLGVEPRR